MTEQNWAGNLSYSARSLHAPRSLDEVRTLVAGAQRVKAIGSRHSFSPIGDTTGDLIDCSGLPRHFDLDEAARSVTVDAGMRCGELASRLAARGWAIRTMASLPHITIVGCVATATHGSGDSVPPLSGLVNAVELVTADGDLQRFRRGDPEFPGVVVNLGALGIVTSLSLDIVPSFELRQDVYEPVDFTEVMENYDHLTSTTYSVSVFTRFNGTARLWLKSTTEPPVEILGVTAHSHDVGMVEGPAERTTGQGGMWGSWENRLPHFKLEFTPSNGEELQSEYLIPREQAATALRALDELGRSSTGDTLREHLLAAEIRSMAAEDQWLSGSYGGDRVGVHFTWRAHGPAVMALLPHIEERLVPLGARPHWGKLFITEDMASLYPQLEKFTALAHTLDPAEKFHNAYLDRLIFNGWSPCSP